MSGNQKTAIMMGLQTGAAREIEGKNKITVAAFNSRVRAK